MSETKNKGGRPRKYPKEDKYARQKAYYERKKKKMKELEERVKKLQNGKDLSPDQKKILEGIDLPEEDRVSWNKITPSEIALMGSQELEQIASNFREKANIDILLKIQIFSLILKTIKIDYLDSSEELSPKDLLEILEEDVESVLNLAEESNQQQTLLYLLEAELDSRGRAIRRESKIDIFETKVEELVKEAKERKVEVKRE